MSDKFQKLVLIGLCILLSGCMENKEDRFLLACGIATGVAVGAALSSKQAVVVRGKINGPVTVQNGQFPETKKGCRFRLRLCDRNFF